tara:strand:- start:1360 stop:2244 length:885 start_codon:yes stop_codon:yes gene_type:complete
MFRKKNILIFSSLPIAIFLITFFRIGNINLSEDKKISISSSESKKVIALTSLSADLISNISEKALVGIPGSSILKKNEQLRNIPIVSSGRMPPNLEKIISLKPDLVVGAKGFHDKTLSKLNDLGIDTVYTSISNFEDLEKLYRNLALKLNAKNIKPLKQILENCYPINNESFSNKKNIVALVSSRPILSPNQNSWAGNLISKFKFINLATDITNKTEFKGYVNLSPEWLLKSQPENLLVIKTPGSDLSQYNSISIWNDLEAVKNNKIYTFDYYGLINPGGLEVIDTACKKLSSI